MLVTIVIAVWTFIAGTFIGFGLGNDEYADTNRKYGGMAVLYEILMALLWPIAIPLALMLGKREPETVQVHKAYLAALGMDDECLYNPEAHTEIHCFSSALPEAGACCNCGSTTYCGDGYSQKVAS